MRKPYPFKVPVDLDAEDVAVKVMVDMPEPYNLTVHLANEHGTETEFPHMRVMKHLMAHLYGGFREGCEHYHTLGECA
jgi:hypothetical protein